MARSTRQVVRYCCQLIPVAAGNCRRSERSENPVARHTSSAVTSARWSWVYAITARIAGVRLVGSESGASTASSHSVASSASAAKNASAVGSLVGRSIGHRIA